MTDKVSRIHPEPAAPQTKNIYFSVFFPEYFSQMIHRGEDEDLVLY